MSSKKSITEWLAQVREGDAAAVQPLWERYFRLLVTRARTILGSVPRRVADEEDVALSAFNSFYQGVQQGRFPKLNDRNDLWRILLVLTARKATHQTRDEFRAKRGGGRVAVEADLPGADSGEAALTRLMATEPGPDMAAELAEEWRRLLQKLGDEELRFLAIWQMEGYTVEEMAAKLGASVRTVARKLTRIRALWSAEG